MSFFDFCRRNKKRNDAVGDFVRDWIRDRERPRVHGKRQVRDYLNAKGASDQCIDAADLAWGEYQWEQHKKHTPQPAPPAQENANPNTKAAQ